MAGRSQGELCDPRNKFLHQVFLSFRGEDVRNGFMSHLFNGLQREGFRVFMDNDGLEHGRDIQIKLYEAIEQSQVSIVTLSPQYADSRWCLDELAKIMELNVSPDRFVLPVFFGVEPTVVRHQTELYKRYFEAHLDKFEIGRVDGWRWALKEIAALKGPSLKDANGIEAQLIQDIIKGLKKILHTQKLHIPSNICGVDSIVRDISAWIQDGSQDVGVGVIHGQGGIGKTTIARIAYNANCNDFNGSSFLEDIRRVLEKDDGLFHLQSKLILDISGSEAGKIYSAYEGMSKIRDVIGPRKILLVLDDVDEMEHLDGLFDHPEWFCPGSKIIITSRNRLLRRTRLFQREFKVHGLKDEDSSKLFCISVFDQTLPLKGYEMLSSRFVKYCEGLPLALSLLGSMLRGEKVIKIWEEKLKKLEKQLNKKIQAVLKLSFDSLEDEDDRNLFLHIAAFFVGRDKKYAFKILKSCGVYTKGGFQNLNNRCLVSLCWNYSLRGYELTMHPLIQEMGRQVVRQESLNEPGLRSRLWDHDETLSVLRNNKGTESVKGLTLAFPAPKSVILKEDRNTQTGGNGIGLASILPPTHSQRMESVDTNAFKSLNKLNLLELSYVKLKGDYAEFPKAIKWLCWRGCPLESIPHDLELYELAVLDMQNSQLLKPWEDNKFLGALKILNLSHSRYLSSTPDLSNAIGLEWISLEGCESLVKIHDSIGSLRQLKYLNLKGCKILRRLPYTIDKLHSIKEVNLSGCTGLFANPDRRDYLIIHAGGSNQSLSPSGSWILPSPFSLLNSFPCIVNLNLSNCGISNDAIFDSLIRLSSLIDLDLSYNQFKEIQLMPLAQLRSLHLQGCRSLERIEYQKNPIHEVAYVFVHNCPKLNVVDCVFKIEHVAKLDACKAKYLGFPKLESIKSSAMLAGPDVYHGLSLGVYEHGIYSIFLHGDHLLEDWFNVTNLGANLLYTVPSDPDHPIRAFNVCCVFQCGSVFPSFIDHLKIENLTTMRHWTYFPTIRPSRLKRGTEITWLAHWSVMLHRNVSAGDKLRVSFRYGTYEDLFRHDPLMVVPIKCGINIVYEVDKEDIDSTISNQPISDNCLASAYHDIFPTVDISEYEIGVNRDVSVFYSRIIGVSYYDNINIIEEDNIVQSSFEPEHEESEFEESEDDKFNFEDDLTLKKTVISNYVLCVVFVFHFIVNWILLLFLLN